MQGIDNLIRQEFKYYVSSEVIAKLRTYLREIMKVDENANSKNHQYTITSLYFDTPNEEDFEDKVDGIKSREKFRLRIYNQRKDIIKFESKNSILVSEIIFCQTRNTLLFNCRKSLCSGTRYMWPSAE